MRQQLEELKKQSNKPVLYYMIDLQNSLMVDILKRKILSSEEKSKLTFKDLTEKMILAMFDEFVEIKDWINEFPDTKYVVKHNEYKIECRYEIVDIYHFLWQLLLIINILGTELKNVRIGDYTSNETRQKIIVEKVTNDIMTTFNLTFDTPYKNVKTYDDLILEGFVKLSKILNLLPWKHWKTYTDDYKIDYQEFLKVVNELHEILSELFVRFGGEKNLESLVVHYMVKNHENFDRQKRGY
jgi:hypothetical protein